MSIAPADPEGNREDKPFTAYLRILLRYRLMVAVVFASVVALAVLKSHTTRPLYKAEAQLLIDRESPSILTFKGVSDVNERGFADDYYQTQNKLLQSRSLARKVVLEMGLLREPEFAADGAAGDRAIDSAVNVFLGKLNVQWIRSSRLVAVSFESRSPELAARAANTLASAYIAQTLEARAQTAVEASRWLARQVEDQRAKVGAAEVALQAVREKEGIVNIDERRVLLEQRLRELGSSLTALKSQRVQKEALYRQMRGERDPEELPEALRSKLIESLRIDLARLERDLAERRQRYLEHHPEVVRLRSQIEETRRTIALESARIVRAAEIDYEATAAQEKGVAGALEAAKAEALDLQRRAVQYDSLKREMEAGKEVLNSLMARLKQADVAQALESSNLRLADPATVPRVPIRPRPALDLLIGIVLGGALAVGLAFLRDGLDDTLKTPDDVRLGLPATLLAVIPRAEAGAAGEGAKGEGYRLLRAALGHAWRDGGGRAVLVTSTAPGEGKTLTSVQLARALAAAGERALLIDADLRKPQAHEVLGGRRSPGLVEVMAGHAKLEDAVQSLPHGPAFLGSGGAAPADLLTADRIAAVLDAARLAYRWVVLDTPPVGAVADALVMAPGADGVVVVAGAEAVPRAAVRRTLERVSESGGRVLGVVLNRARVDLHSHDYQHHYGHGYGDYHTAPAPTPPEIAPLKQRVVP